MGAGFAVIVVAVVVVAAAVATVVGVAAALAMLIPLSVVRIWLAVSGYAESSGRPLVDSAHFGGFASKLHEISMGVNPRSGMLSTRPSSSGRSGVAAPSRPDSSGVGARTSWLP